MHAGPGGPAQAVGGELLGVGGPQAGHDDQAGGGPGGAGEHGRAVDLAGGLQAGQGLGDGLGGLGGQARVRQLAQGPGVILVCGRFEGFDERIFDGRDVEEVSVGDIVLSGGEPAALMLLDACIRLLPGVMGAPSSGHEESFENGLLEYPHYTRPQEWEGRTIPEVLRSGDHARIAQWRKRRSEDDTRSRRPDLWERHTGVRVQSASGAQREVQDVNNEPDSAA